MSRAIRRHPSTKQKNARPAKPPISRPTTQRRSGGEGRGRVSSLLRPHWAEEIISELRKVTWPSMEDTRYLTFVVLVVAVAFGIFLGGIDMFFNWAIDNTLLKW